MMQLLSTLKETLWTFISDQVENSACSLFNLLSNALRPELFSNYLYHAMVLSPNVPDLLWLITFSNAYKGIRRFMLSCLQILGLFCMQFIITQKTK
jgi:hypothetical protein